MLPEHLKIGYEVVRVSVAAKGAIEGDGEHSRDHATILIDGDMTERRLAATLVHEVFHAAWDMTEMPAGEKELGALKEEDVVARLSTVLAQVLMDNPALLRCLESAGQAENGTCWKPGWFTSSEMDRIKNIDTVQRGSEQRSEQECDCCLRATECSPLYCLGGR